MNLKFKNIINHSLKCNSYILIFIFLIIFFLGISFDLKSQSGACDGTVPVFIVNLSSDPNSTWSQVGVNRDGSCCSYSHPPNSCVKFILTLHENAGSIIFKVTDGALPQNLEWQLMNSAGDFCNPTKYPADTPVCMNGVGPHTIVFCKPGGNGNTYTITSIPSNAATTSTSFNGCDNILDAGASWNNYLWNTGDTTQFITAQDSGWYWVNATSSTCSSKRDSFYVAYNPPISLGNDTTICSGSMITLSPGNNFNYYQWSNGVSSATANSIQVGGGTYSVTVTDANNCTSAASIKIIQNPELLLNASVSNVKCIGNNDGAINISVSGGNPPFSYFWSTGAITEDVTFLPAGSYTITVIDAIGCTKTLTSTINSPVALSGTIVSTNVSCYESTNGSLDLTVSGGTFPYSYIWSTGATTQDILNLNSGNYFVTITDANLCQLTLTERITKPNSPLSAFIIGNNVSCKGGNNGSTNVTVNGGTSPYSYNWSNFATTQNISNLIAGTYIVTVYDINACSTISSITIAEPQNALSSSIVGSPALCYNELSGSIDLTVNGGTPEYSYIWNIGQITEDINGVGAGTYNVTVSDINNCNSYSNILITQPTEIVINEFLTNISCFGANNGNIIVNPTGGTIPYSYLWSNGNITNSVSGLMSDIYHVTVNDLLNCENRSSIVVTQPLAITTSNITINVKCKGQATGSVNLTVNGGTAPYSYNWSNGSTNEDINNLSAGVYSVTITDSNGCIAYVSSTITEPVSSLSANIAPTNLSCNSSPTGSLNLTVSGGTPNYTYLWSNGLTNEDLTGLLAGVYSVTIKDANQCTHNLSSTITEPTDINIVSSKVNSDCGLSNGSITTAVSGGQSPYSYLWSNGSTNNSLTNIPSGAYSLTVTDANNCLKITTINVNDNTAPTVTVSSSSNVTCYGSSNGAAAVTVTGGVSPYIYQWSSGGGSSSVSGLSGGIYSVSVIDNNGCKGNITLTITEPSQISKILIPRMVNCYGGNDGAVNLIVSGGTSPYSYIWNSGHTTEDLLNISSGIYSVTITDNNSCQTNSSVTVTQPPSALATSLAVTNVKCFGGSNGSINLTVLGGTVPYSYQWSSGQNSEDLINITAGNYTVTVTDANNCTTSSSISVSEPILLTASIVATNVSCSGGNDAIVDLTVAGGTPSYSYSWNYGQITQDLNGVSAGVYEVTVTDSKLCNASTAVTITEPSSPLSASISKTNVKCFGGNTGAANLTVTGGTVPYSYLWSSGQTSQDLSNIAAGVYTVTITDFKSCKTVVSTTITQPNQLTGSIIPKNLNCYGGNDGEANLTVSGGTPIYSYQWNIGMISEDISGLIAGVYTVTITDSKLCKTTTSITITQPSQIIVTSIVNNVSCYGGNNATIDVSVNGGTVPYTYSWNIGQTTQDISNLISGTYQLTVSDANSCSVVTTFSISQPSSALTSSVIGTNLKCRLGADGKAEVNASGGTGAYTYLWSNAATTREISGLSAGVYTVTVSDGNSCKSVSSVTIAQPATSLSLSSIETNLTCNNINSGAINLTVSGGSSPYSYNWSNSSLTEDISNLYAGTYIVTVTDNNLCVKTHSATLIQPTAISVTSTKVNATCGSNNGSANITITGGTSPYSVLWSNASTTTSITNLTSGAYSVTVTDNNLCTTIHNVNINNTGGPSISVSYQSDVKCAGDGNGKAVVTVLSGLAPYTYSWSAGSTTNTQENLSGGIYTVTVSDVNACKSTASVTISEPNLLSTSVYMPSLCNAGSSGFIDLSVTGGIPNYTYTWSNGTTSQDLININAGNYTVTIKDVNQCTKVETFNLTTPAVTLASSFTSTNVKCYNGNDGSIDLSVIGGTAPYTYLWNNGQITQDITQLTIGNYEVTVTDAISCKSVTSISVTEPQPLSVAVTKSNVNCNGGTSGSISLNVLGGTPVYSYNWSSGQSTASIVNLSANTYSVTITDANNCKIYNSVTITQPTAISSSIAGTNVKCFGSNGGAANLSVSGGTPAYTFLWTNAATTEDINNISAGIYTVTITDSKNCTNVKSVTITEPTQLAATITKTNVNCFNGSDGNINLTISGGTPNYSYIWNYGQSSEDLNNIPSGFYQVTVTDANLCTITTNTNITQPASSLSTSISKTNVKCNGGSSGIADLSVSGGTPSYNYSWSNGQTIQDLNNITAGNYSVTVTDGNGCTSVSNVTITQPAIISIANAVTNVKCNGGSSGAINITVSGGVPSYTFLWSNGQAVEDIAFLSAGNYTVTTSDANLCTSTSTITVTQPSQISSSYTKINLICNGQLNGQIDLSVSGGTPNYSYIWNNGISTQDLTNLSGGVYEVTISDANQCLGFNSVTITEPNQLSVNVLTTNIKCNGVNSGSIDLIVSGGTPNYTYLWSNGATSEDLSNIAAGTYRVTVTDANLCQSIKTVTITQPANPLSANIIKTNVSCYGGSNGIADLTVSGGIVTYSYLWNTGQSIQDLTNISAGNYTVTITDANNCTTTSSVTISQPDTLFATYSSNNVNCYGGSSGSINITVSGGTPIYSYTWSSGQTIEDLVNISAGTYNLTITDANNCKSYNSISVTQPLAALSTNVNTSNVLCNGGNTGSIDIEVAGGTSPYSYLWNFGQTTQDLNSVVAGIYTVTVTDSKNCKSSRSVTITEPSSMVANIIVTPVKCTGNSDGIANLTVTGGTSPYIFLWSNLSTNEDLINISAGNYTVSITDANNCSITSSTTVTQPSILTSSIVPTNVACKSESTGSANLTVTGGSPSYSYLWNFGQLTEDLIGVSAGIYSVTVTDSKNCKSYSSVTISEPAAVLSTLISKTDVKCYGGSTGIADLSVNGGTAPYSYSWNFGQTTQDLTNISAGVYTVTVTDFNGCTSNNSITINQSSLISATYVEAKVKCKGNATGAIDLVPSGGTPPYSYTWSNGATTEDITNVIAGNYTVTIKDSYLCSIVKTVTVTEPTQILSSTFISTNVSCFGGNNANINLNVTGGTPSYSYIWNNGATSEDISSLSQGVYEVTITDANLCRAYNSITITQPTEMVLSTIQTNSTCGVADGTASVSATGGTLPYSYLWSNGSSTSAIANVIAGLYSVTVTDNKSCYKVANVAVNDQGAPSCNILSSTNVTCYGMANGSATVLATGGTGAYVYSWSNGFNSTNATNLSGGVYYVSVTDDNNCLSTSSVTISEPMQLIGSIIPTPVKCKGGNTGFANLTVSGGTPAYTYNWSSSLNTEDISNLYAGSYRVTITDSKGCATISNVTITEPSQPITLSTTKINVLCKGGNNGSIDLSVSGGTPNYTYLWNFGQTSQDISLLTATSYEVTVTDANLCKASTSVLISEPNEIQIQSVITNATCNGQNNGAINITLSGGTPIYSYVWSNGSTNEDLNNISGGVYTVSVYDINSCLKTKTITVTEPTGLAYTIVPKNVKCFGESTGEINLTVIGGTQPYTYIWNNGSTNEDISGLISGIYSVTITDIKNCSSIATTTISQPLAPLSANHTITDVKCYNLSTGSITTIASGGTTPYSYLWNYGQTTGNLTSLQAGSYQLTITDANSCKFTSPVVVNEPSEIILSPGQTGSTCGMANGSANIIVSGGISPFTYLWNTGSTSSSISNLTAGAYNVVVTDANLCQSTATINVSDAGAPTSTVAYNNVTCNGMANGNINVSVNGGTLPYSYIWSNGTTVEDLSNVSGGIYNLTITDSNNCKTTQSITVNEPLAISISDTVKNINCFGDGNGFIDITVSGGTPAFSYLWNSGQITQDLNGIGGGVYSLTITDLNNCKAYYSKTITEPSQALNLINSGTNNVSCYNGNNGSINISVSGGTAPYTYLWNTGQTFEDLNNIIAGIYQVTVTDSKNCTKTISSTITQPTILQANISATNVKCRNGSDGIADLTVSGGISPYNYFWTFGQTTQDLNNVIAGAYSVTITDSNNCKAYSSTTISQPSAGLSMTSIVKNINCKGDSTGNINITINGGTQPYTFVWNNGQTSEDITNLPAGNYVVTVTDLNGCKYISNNIPVQQPLNALTSTFTYTDVKCYSGNNASINLTVSGGAPLYSYLWSNGQTTQDLNNLYAGNYTVTITDGNLCKSINNITITQPSEIISSIIKTDVTCFGLLNGLVDLSVNGGTLPYSYSWNYGQTTQDLNNISAGTYIVTITDANSCRDYNSVVVSQPSILSSSVISTQVKCKNDSTGRIDLVVTGGTVNYTYIWSNGATTEDLSNLFAGVYSVTISDSKNCKAYNQVTIQEPATAISGGFFVTNVSCNGQSNGAINLTVSGGTGTYSYAWNYGQTTEDLNGLLAGKYEVTVIDQNNCVFIDSVQVTQPQSLMLTPVKTNSTCGISNGSASVNVVGGTAPYSYLWSTGFTGQGITNISAGAYSVTVTDFKGCQKTLNINVNDQGAPVSSISSYTNPSCYGYNNGSATVSAIGGTGTYTYLWTNGQTNATSNNLSVGTYSVSVIDQNGCISSSTIEIGQPEQLVLSFENTNVSCFGGSNGSINMTVSGGTPAYSYHWNYGQSTQDLFNLSIGTYEVTVTDSKNCTAFGSTTLVQPNQSIIISSVKTNVSCFNGNNGSINISVLGGTAPYSYLWNTGQTIEDIGSLIAGAYEITITDSKSCTSTHSVTITQPNQINISSVITNASCYLQNNGNIDISVVGGTSPYTYNWSNASTSQDLNNVYAGIYSITVTDNLLCKATASITITQPALIQTLAVVSNVKCYSGSDGAINLDITGGTLPYTYNWNNGQTIEDISGLSAGSYQVTITDSKLCDTVINVPINQPSSPISISSTLINVNCFGGNNGAIDLSISGGTAPYTYIWNYGQTTEDISNLNARNYQITITDANGCDTTISYQITQPTQIQLTPFVTYSTCNGSTGMATVSVSGGTSPYSYLWSNSSQNDSLLNIQSGAYSVSVTDMNGCMRSITANVNDLGAPDLSVTHNNVSCFGYQDGSINLTLSGSGTSPFTYSWSNGESTEDINLLSGGRYYVTVTDANGCKAFINDSITEYPQLQSRITTNDVTCFNISDGSINLTVSGGTGAGSYTYLWSNSATSEDLNNISSGIYYVTIADANGCKIIDSVNVGQPADSIYADYLFKNVSCYGNSDAYIDIIVYGGTPNYTYLWNLGQTSEDIYNIQAFNYEVTITDANNCSIIKQIPISQPALLTVSYNSQNISCKGGNDGTIDLTVSGGTPSYSYVWDVGDTIQNITALSYGVYSVTVTDANNCKQYSYITLTEPIMPLTIQLNGNNVLCNGGNNGSAFSIVYGGSSPYIYIWSNGSTSQSINNLVAGDYFLTVTDSKGCTTQNKVTITEPQLLTSNIETIDVNCYQELTGSINLSVYGGVQPYYYQWSPGNITQDLNNIGAGIYQVTITDANGCKNIAVTTITQPSQIIVSENITNITCNGYNNGSIYLSVNGGVPSYSYIWNYGYNTDIIDSLYSGMYEVTITDLNNCSLVRNYNLTQPSKINISISKLNVSCNGRADGKITMTVSGGTPNYTYIWSNGATSRDIQNLIAGNYTVTITDNNNCLVDSTIIISQPDSLISIVVASMDASNNGDCDGYLSIGTTGGTPAYSYIWNNGLTGPTQNGLCQGIYYITVTDENGCLTIVSHVINKKPPLPVAAFSLTDNGCPPLEVTFTNNSLFGEYFFWDFGDGSTDTAKNPVHTYIQSGVYVIKLIAYGITGENITYNTITVYNKPSAAFSVAPEVVTVLEKPIHCYNWSFGGDTYLWHFGDSAVSNEVEPVHYYQSEGSYDITLEVWTRNGCYDSLTIENAVTVIMNCTVVFPDAFIPSKTGPVGGYWLNEDYYSNRIFHPVQRKVQKYKLEIFNRWGELIFVSEDINVGWDGYYQGKLSQQDVYVYKATWICEDGKEYVKLGDLTLYH